MKMCIAQHSRFADRLNLLSSSRSEELESQAIQWIASAMTILLVAAWLLDLALMAKAILTRQIYWPGQDEDKGMDLS